jgi:hypothetical protein
VAGKTINVTGSVHTDGSEALSSSLLPVSLLLSKGELKKRFHPVEMDDESAIS